jgi:hypothetical protein
MNDYPPADPGTPAPASTWVPVTAIILAEGKWNTYPGNSFVRVLFTFDPRYRDDLVFLDRTRAHVIDLQGRSPVSSDERRLADILVRDHVPHQFPRWELPAALTGGFGIYLAEMLLPHRLLTPNFSPWDQYQRFVPCRAELCAGGRLELLPYRRADVERRVVQWLRCLQPRAVEVTAALVQANEALYRPGPDDLPCMVLITFEDLPNQDRYLRRLAEHMYALKGLDLDDPDERYVSSLITDERAKQYRRRSLPPSFTGGPVVYAADLRIHRPFLRHGYLVGKLLPCLAEPGDQGCIEMLPPGGLQELDTRREDLAEVVVVENGEEPAAPVPRGAPRPLPPPRGLDQDEDRPGRRPRGVPARGSPLPWIIGGAVAGLVALGVLAAVFIIILTTSRPIVLSNPRTERGLGMQVTFHVDYRFDSNTGPVPGVNYILVIRPRHGGMRREFRLMPWQLQRQGSLAQMVLIVFGEGGPFEGFMESESFHGRGRSRAQVSNTVMFP